MSLSHRVYSNNSSSSSTPFNVKQSFITYNYYYNYFNTKINILK